MFLLPHYVRGEPCRAGLPETYLSRSIFSSNHRIMLSVATLAGGCFWCLEAVFTELRGVERVESGYMGGHVKNPSYREVCEGTTGHAEVVQVHFDPSQISYADLLNVFFTIHDPTQLNRQGNDVGTQYRSAIFHHDDNQRRAAESAIENLAKSDTWDAPIVTSVQPAGDFFPAGVDHADYYARNPNQPYCAFVIAPKVAKARRKFVEQLKRA